jgi:hypothetical protein
MYLALVQYFALPDALEIAEGRQPVELADFYA